MKIQSEADDSTKCRESGWNLSLVDEEKLVHAKRVSRDEDEAERVQPIYRSRIYADGIVSTGSPC